MREFLQNNSSSIRIIKDIMFENTKHVSLKAILSSINLPPSENLPRIVLAVAPCRSGTTAQLRMFSALNIPSYYQPLKSILRRQAQSIEGKFTIPSNNIIFIKETLGPYSHAESVFNPLEILLEAGYPKDKLTVIAEMREPLSTLTSWFQTELPSWQNRDALLANFISAYKTIPQILQQAWVNDIQALPYMYEAQRDTDPSFAVEKLLSYIHLPFTDLAVTGWDRLPPFGTPESNIFFSIEPSLYNGAFHDVATNSHKLNYTKKTEQSIDNMLLAREVEKVEQESLSLIYEYMRNMVENVLGLQVCKSTEIEQFKQRFAQRELR